MIYVMSQKFFKKKIEKMAKFNEYFILDGENYGVTNRGDSGDAIASKYARAHAVGGFCPEARLYGFLRKKKKEEEINENKYEKELDKFINDKSFVASVNAAFKAIIGVGLDHPLNIFVVLPNIVYKFIGKKIVKKMIKLGKMDFDFIFTEEDLDDNIKILKNKLSKDQLEAIDKRSKKIEKKYELKYYEDDFN